MAENYSLNSGFGFNVLPKGKSSANQKEVQEEKNLANLFDPVGNYIDKYENVFTGNVEQQINMYSRQAMIVGMNLKAAEVKRSFDMNI